MKCLEKNVSKRYASPEELKEDLNRFLEGRPIHARPASWVQVSGKWMRRNPASTVSILALLVVIVGAVVGLVMHNSVLSQELARSRRLANSGSRFAKWITEDHLGALNQVSGTTVPRTQLIQRVSDYLQESYDDMPSDPVYTERLGFTYSQLAATQGAGAQNTTANLDGARKNLERAIELYDLTLEENSKDAKTFERVTQLKVDALVSLCDLEGRLGNEQAQKQFLEDAKTLLPEIKEKSPQASFIRIQILGRETESLLAQGEFRKALNSLEPLAAAVTGLESFDDDENAQVEASNQRIVICGYRSTCLKNLDDYPGAEKSLREMVRLSENAADPENVLHEKRLSSTLVNLGDIIFEQEKANESLEIYERACKIARVLADEDPSSVDAQLSLGVKLSRLARNHQFLGNFQLADTAIKEAIDRLKLLVSQGKKDISIEKGFIIYQQTYATLGFLQGDLEKSQQRFAEHHKSCLEFKQRFEDKGFAINQLAESELTQALMLFDVWFKGDPIDPTKVREAAEYKQIKAHLKQSLQYYNEFESIKPLDVTQRNQVQSIVAVEKMLEDTVKEIESQADQ